MPRAWLDIKKSMRLLVEFDEDERLALSPNEPFTVAIACIRCGRVRIEEIRGLTPLAQPRPAPFRCTEADSNQVDGRCGGEVWSYDDNDLGRQHAKALGIPTR
jgi:hypothetical protein